MRRIQETESLCPVCFRRLRAFYEEDGDGAVFLSKTCREHGAFSALVWPSRSQAPDIGPFKAWSIPKTPSYPLVPATQIKDGCPFDCGLCPVHAQHTCHGLVELTMRCNLSCPLCYASSGNAGAESDVPFEVVRSQLETLKSMSGACNVQLSGGEPTVRDDLPRIVAMAKGMDFGLVQVNTNGVRLGLEEGYAGRLADAGLDSVYLQWDGADAKVLETLRGRRVANLLEVKEEAVRRCAEAGLGVVLVATVVAGVNDTMLGDILRDAVAKGPAVRGLHLQPASFFGRTPWTLEKAPRCTLGHVMQSLISGAPEWVKPGDFHPPHCEHSLCSFSAVYARTPEGGLVCERGEERKPGVPVVAAEGSRKAKAFIAGQWSRPPKPGSCCSGKSPALLAGQDAFARFLAKRTERRFTLSGMAFQDALSLDLRRLQGCCIHVMRPDGRMVPFCAQNMTSVEGKELYPGRGEWKK